MRLRIRELETALQQQVARAEAEKKRADALAQQLTLAWRVVVRSRFAAARAFEVGGLTSGSTFVFFGIDACH